MREIIERWRKDPRPENPLWRAACWAATALEAEAAGLIGLTRLATARAADLAPESVSRMSRIETGIPAKKILRPRPWKVSAPQ